MGSGAFRRGRDRDRDLGGAFRYSRRDLRLRRRGAYGIHRASGPMDVKGCVARLHPTGKTTHYILCVAPLRGPPIGGQDRDGESYRRYAPYTLSRFAGLPLKGKREI